MTIEPKDVKSGRTLETWESWVDEAIRGAQSRGDFDNLPGTGKPLNLERNPLAGDREAGFHVLKNADLAPYWMELDKELSKAVTDLDQYRQRATARLDRLRARACASRSPAPLNRTAGRGDVLLRWLRGASSIDASERREFDVRTVERERQATRRQYLEKAASVDKLIVEYNSSLPDEIRWLERPRLLPEHAARQFDAECAPLTCEAH